MRELDRISRLFRLLVGTYRLPVSLRELQERLDGASSATVKRDIAFLRDSLLVPVVYDREANGYYIQNDATRRAFGYTVPGLWIDGREAYAFLTLYNVLSRIDPGVIGPLVQPLRGVLKKVMSDSQVRGYGFDRKIKVDLGMPQPDYRSALSDVSYALANDELVFLTFKDGSAFIDGNYWPRCLTLKPGLWVLSAALETGGSDLVEIPMDQVDSCSSVVNHDSYLSQPPFPAG